MIVPLRLKWSAMILSLGLIVSGHWLQVHYQWVWRGLILTLLGTLGFVAAGYNLAPGAKREQEKHRRVLEPGDPALKEGNEPYLLFEIPARRIKILLQMLIGLAFAGRMGWCILKDVGVTPILVAGKALEYATAVELLYSLFTFGFDEAVDPAIMAVAATILIALSSGPATGFQMVSSILGYVIVLGVLFWIRKHFMIPEQGAGSGQESKVNSR